MDLVARIEKLEADNRRYQRMNIVAFAMLCGAGVLMGAHVQPTPSRLVVQDITFTDQQGKPLWKISPVMEGANTTAPKTKLVFASTLMSERAEFGEIASLNVHQNDGHARFLTFPDSHGEAAIGVFRGGRGTTYAAVRLKGYNREAELHANISGAQVSIASTKEKGAIRLSISHIGKPEIAVESTQGGSLFQVKE